MLLLIAFMLMLDFYLWETVNGAEQLRMKIVSLSGNWAHSYTLYTNCLAD